MNPLLAQPAFVIYATAVAVVALHLLLLALWTGTVRGIHKKFTMAEDARFVGGTLVDEDIEAVARVKRAHTNTIESALPFVAVGFLYALTDPDPFWAKLLLFGYVAARLVHTLVYLRGVQPWRTLTFALGVLSIGSMSIAVLRAVM